MSTNYLITFVVAVLRRCNCHRHVYLCYFAQGVPTSRRAESLSHCRCDAINHELRVAASQLVKSSDVVLAYFVNRRGALTLYEANATCFITLNVHT